MNDLIKDMEAMSKVLEDGIYTEPVSTEAPVTGSAVTDSASTDAPATESASTSAPATAAPTTDSASTDAPSTDAPPDPVEALKSEIAELKGVIDQLKSGKTTKAPSTEAPTTNAPIDEVDFVGDIEDLRDLVDDPKEFNKLLNNIYTKAIETARNEISRTQEFTLKSIPEIVKTNIATVTTLKKVSEKFYSDNKDLVPFKKVVGAVFEELASQNPDKGYVDLLDDVAAETRRRLDLHKKATKHEKNNPPPPRRTKQSRGRGQSKPPDSLVSEIEEMNKVLT